VRDAPVTGATAAGSSWNADLAASFASTDWPPCSFSPPNSAAYASTWSRWCAATMTFSPAATCSRTIPG
jgi:hypothetical protein